MKTKNKINLALVITFALFIISSFIFNISIGHKMWDNFKLFAWDMTTLLPPAFILIGLFNVWVKRETIENNFGEQSGFERYIWSILLAATTVGGTFVAFPVGNELYHKGAHYNSIFAYVTSASLVMIPMSIIEASILGIKFTSIRLGVSIPLVIISSALLGSYFEGSGYELPKQE
ncbi:MAG: permease [Halanaerobacter sp.]